MTTLALPAIRYGRIAYLNEECLEKTSGPTLILLKNEDSVPEEFGHGTGKTLPFGKRTVMNPRKISKTGRTICDLLREFSAKIKYRIFLLRSTRENKI